MDYHLRLHVVQMSARIFDYPVVILRERSLSSDGDDRMDRYPGRNGNGRQCLDKRVAGRHVIDTARQAPQRQRRPTALPVTSSSDASMNPLGRLAKPATHWAAQSRQLVAPAVRRSDEDHAAARREAVAGKASRRNSSRVGSRSMRSSRADSHRIPEPRP